MSSKNKVNIYFEGTKLEVPNNITVAAAVLQHTHHFATNTMTKKTMGPTCLMGVCFECMLEIDGKPNQQSCLIPVCDGMQIKRQVPFFESLKEDKDF